MIVRDLIAALQGMDQSLPVVVRADFMMLRDATVRIELVGARSSYGNYSLAPDAQHAEGWRGELSVVVIA